MAGRFSHLDFDDLPEKPKPRPKAPAPLTGAAWGPNPGIRRSELRLGRSSFTYLAEPANLTFDGPSDQIPMIRPRIVEFDVSTREDYPSFDSIMVRLGVRHGMAAWEYQQVAVTREAVQSMLRPTPILRKVFAPDLAVVVAVDPKVIGSLRVYVESAA